MTFLVKGCSSNFCFSRKISYFKVFEIQVAVSFSCISQAIKVQMFYPGTPLETRDQELSFGTKIHGIL